MSQPDPYGKTFAEIEANMEDDESYYVRRHETVRSMILRV